jgi:plastocyanin
MRRLLLCFILGLVVPGSTILVGCGSASRSGSTTVHASPPVASVIIPQGQEVFSPFILAVQPNTIVTWQNNDTVMHTIMTRGIRAPSSIRKPFRCMQRQARKCHSPSPSRVSTTTSIIVKRSGTKQTIGSQPRRVAQTSPCRWRALSGCRAILAEYRLRQQTLFPVPTSCATSC